MVSDDFELAVGWGVAALGPFTVVTMLTPFREQVHAATFVVVVLIALIGAAAMLAGPMAATVATIMAVLSFDFFFLHPYLVLKVDAEDGMWPVVVLSLAGLCAVAVARQRSRRSTRASKPSTRPGPNRSRHIERIVHLIEQGVDSNDLISAVQAELTGLLLARSCRFEPGEPTSVVLRIERNGSVAGSPAFPPSQAEDLELPVSRGDRYVGRFVLTPTVGASVPAENWIVAVILTDHLAAAVISRKPAAPG
jgi:Domain of unknown function (DUF4118)